MQSRNLGEYYELRRSGSQLREPLPASAAELREDFTYLDDRAFRNLYSVREEGEAEQPAWKMKFYLEGMHCFACTWLLEKLPDFVSGIRKVEIRLAKSTLTVWIDERGSFAQVARECERLGYRPHAVRDDDIESHQKRENRKDLIRIGVAGACAGNIMLLAFSVYGGARGSLAQTLNWLSFALFLPVALFSATPFYRDAWAALRKRALSIDVPIVLGIVLAALASAYHLLIGSLHVYFDSLSTLVFLLLASRFVLKRTQQSALRSTRLLHFITPSIVHRYDAGRKEFEDTTTELLQAGDIVEIRSGELVPVDGVVCEGEGHLNCAALTGESTWVEVGPGSPVFAGTTSQGRILRVQVARSGYKTRLGRILKSIEDESGRKPAIVTLVDRVSRYFILGVLLASSLAFFFGWHLGFHEALNRALAMLIITCPCGLALATPLALSASLGKASRMGILIKGADVLERLSQVQTVFLDKTGTLTEGNFEVMSWVGEADDLDAMEAALALEEKSNHPVAKAIVRYLGEKPECAKTDRSVDQFREDLGKGVSGWIAGHFYELKRGSGEGDGTRVVLERDHLAIAAILLGDQLRPSAKQAVQELRRMGFGLKLLSGDGARVVAKVAREVGIDPSATLAEATPETKVAVIKASERALMVGDGANDALALTSAHVGVAVHGGMEVSLRAADVYISRPGLFPLVDLLVLGRETMSVIRRNLVFSLLYNFVGAALALTGAVNPLMAAIIMPLSALTVFVSSSIGTRKLRSRFTARPARAGSRPEDWEVVAV